MNCHHILMKKITCAKNSGLLKQVKLRFANALRYSSKPMRKNWREIEQQQNRTTPNNKSFTWPSLMRKAKMTFLDS